MLQERGKAAQATREAHGACRGVGAVRCTAQAGVAPEHRRPGPSGRLRNGAGTVRGYAHLPSRLSLLLPGPLGPKHKMTARDCYSTVIEDTDSGTD